MKMVLFTINASILNEGDKMANFTWNVTGLTDLENKISEMVIQYPNLVAKSLEKEANATMDISQNLVPVDTGALKKSKFIEKPVISVGKVSITLGYGGKNVQINPKSGKPTSDYAAFQHEMHSAKSKFLENPIKERKNDLLNRITHDTLELIKTTKGGD